MLTLHLSEIQLLLLLSQRRSRIANVLKILAPENEAIARLAICRFCGCVLAPLFLFSFDKCGKSVLSLSGGSIGSIVENESLLLL